MPGSNYTIKLQQSLDAYSPEDWNQLNSDDNPFLRHEFLHGLEITGCLEPEGWHSHHICVEDSGQLVAAMPLYLRNNSYGEFIFDWAWADAYERAGGKYYPKFVSAIPFTPVQGHRLLVQPERDDASELKQLLVQSLVQSAQANNISTCHSLFPVEEDISFYTSEKFMRRDSFQFHWYNRGYRNFDDFLSGLTSKKRKQIKRERRQAIEAGIEISVLKGSEISDEQWQVFYEFYCSTFYRRWGNPRLTLDFFRLLSEKMPGHTLLILASQESQYIAGAFAMLGKDTLYGRHWGCKIQLPFLHFELCYYQTIEYCIEHGLTTLDAGVQGEHKLNRGFDPVRTNSCHWVNHEGFREAIDEFLTRESREIDFHLGNMKKHTPYKEDPGKDDNPG